MLDDIKFICLDKWNRSLIKLLRGRALDMCEGKQTGSLRSPVWEEIIQARQAKANELLQEALQNDSTEEQISLPLQADPAVLERERLAVLARDAANVSEFRVTGSLRTSWHDAQRSLLDSELKAD